MTTFRVIDPSRWRFATSGHVAGAARRAETFRARRGTLAGAERDIEEFVRQWALQSLIDDYGYPASWLTNRIVIERGIQCGSRIKNRADIAILRADWSPSIIIETKSYDSGSRSWANGINQLKSYLTHEHTATIGLLTDGVRSHCIEKVWSPEYKFVTLPAFPSFDPNAWRKEAASGKRVSRAQAKTVDSFVLGALYTRREISDKIGGSMQSYLPRANGRVVAGCFTTELNPEAPFEVLVGDGVEILKSARALAVQGGFIPVFMKIDVNQWEYAGDFRCTDYTESPRLVNERARAAGREAVGLLSLEMIG